MTVKMSNPSRTSFESGFIKEALIDPVSASIMIPSGAGIGLMMVNRARRKAVNELQDRADELDAARRKLEVNPVNRVKAHLGNSWDKFSKDPKFKSKLAGRTGLALAGAYGLKRLLS